MSGPIRKLIGPTKTRALGYIQEAGAALELPLDDDTLDESENTCEDLFNRLTRCVTLLEKCNSDWTSLLKTVQGDEKTEEEREYDRVSDGEQGLVRILLDSNDTLAQLTTRISRLRRRRTVIERHALQPDHVIDAHAPPAAAAQGGPQRHKQAAVTLPKIQLSRRRTEMAGVLGRI